MDITLSLGIVNSGELDLPKDDRPVRGRGAADLDEIVADGERNEVVVCHALCARPHTGLVLVPVVARLEDLGLDGVLDDLEGLEGLLRRGMGGVEVELFLGC